MTTQNASNVMLYIVYLYYKNFNEDLQSKFFSLIKTPTLTGSVSLSQAMGLCRNRMDIKPVAWDDGGVLAFKLVQIAAHTPIRVNLKAR